MRFFDLLIAIAITMMVVIPAKAGTLSTSDQQQINGNFCKCVKIDGTDAVDAMVGAWRDSSGAVVMVGIGFMYVNPPFVNQMPSGGYIEKPGWRQDNHYNCACTDTEGCLMDSCTAPGLHQGWVSYWMDGICVIGYTNILEDDPDNWLCNPAVIGGCP